MCSLIPYVERNFLFIFIFIYLRMMFDLFRFQFLPK